MKNCVWALTAFLMLGLSFARADELGGAGVETNGVYQTFYSAGILVNPQAEEELPGAELYLGTISSLIENGPAAAKLIANALPTGRRVFYRILEKQMDDKVMPRLLEEYARVTKQPVEKLSIFAFTDLNKKATFLLPSFYKLTETEQAAIIFHESYWLMRPQADYAEVIGTEMAFQEYIEKGRQGFIALKLPRILEELTGERTIAIKAALAADAKLGNAPTLVDPFKNVSISELFQDKKHCEFTTSLFSDPIYLTANLNCSLTNNDIQDVFLLSKKFPRSLFLKELIHFLVQGQTLNFSKSLTKVVLRTQIETGKAQLREKLFSPQQIFPKKCTGEETTCDDE